MRGAPRIVAAALVGCVLAGLVLVALASASGVGVASLVKLQVAPRGPGTVSATPAGVDSDGNAVTQPCAENEESASCEWSYPAGTTVALTAKADDGKRFFGWSSPDCPGTGTCRATLDADITSVVAQFNPLRLGVALSVDNEGNVHGRVTSSPGNINCHSDQCFDNFTPNSRVTLTASPDSGNHAFTRWTGACESTSGRTCVVVVNDEPTWVGAIFDGEPAPQLATTISVQFRVHKSGNGGGRVMASNLDCGSRCSAQFIYGRRITLTAKEDDGSTFEGWNGVCARTQKSCSFSVGPITSIRATFSHDTAPPSVPGGLSVRSTARTALSLTWNAATDNIGVTGYGVYVNGASAGETKTTEFTLTGLSCGRSYDIGVDAVDGVGNRSARATVTANTNACPLAVRVVGARVLRSAGSRTVEVTLKLSSAARVKLALIRNRRSAVTRNYRVRAGSNVLRMRVARRLPGGSYRLRITVVDDAGATRTLFRTLSLPRP
jgi:hypothetical protein